MISHTTPIIRLRTKAPYRKHDSHHVDHHYHCPYPDHPQSSDTGTYICFALEHPPAPGSQVSMYLRVTTSKWVILPIMVMLMVVILNHIFCRKFCPRVFNPDDLNFLLAPFQGMREVCCANMNLLPLFQFKSEPHV